MHGLGEAPKTDVENHRPLQSQHAPQHDPMHKAAQAAPLHARTVSNGKPISKWTANPSRIVLAPLNVNGAAHGSRSPGASDDSCANMSSCTDQSSIAQVDESSGCVSTSAAAVAAAVLSPGSDRRHTAGRDGHSLFSPAFLAAHGQRAHSRHASAAADPIPSPDMLQAHLDDDSEQQTEGAVAPVVDTPVAAQPAHAHEHAHTHAAEPSSTSPSAPSSSKPERKVRLTLAELSAREESSKALMTSAGQVCMAAWVTALEASKEYRRVRKEWRRARAKLQKRQGRSAALEPAAALVQLVPEETETAEGPEEPEEEDQVEQVEHAVQVLQSAQVEAEEEAAAAAAAAVAAAVAQTGAGMTETDEEIASFQSGQLCLRTAVAASDALSAERALEGLVDEVLAESATSFHESQRLLEEQQRRYTLELATHGEGNGTGLAALHDLDLDLELDLGAPLLEEVAEEAELLQLTIESEALKRQLAATEAEEAALRAEEEALLAEQARLQNEEAQEGDESLENFVVTKPRRVAATVTSTAASDAPASHNGVLMFSPPRGLRAGQTAAQRKASLLQSRAVAAADKERRAALKKELESDLAAHESRRQALLASKHAKAAEAERRRQAAREKVDSADAARRSKFARVVQAAAGVEEARRLRHAEEAKQQRAQAKAKIVAAAAAAASSADTGAEGSCSSSGGLGSACESCERFSALRLANAEERRRRHLDELRERCTNEEDLARARAALAARDATGASHKSALLEESERKRLDAEARRARSHEEGRAAKAALKEKKRIELAAQIQELKQKEGQHQPTTHKRHNSIEQ